MDIQEFRQQYPEYGGVPDEQLATTLHQKYYPNVPYEEFKGRFLGSIQAPPTKPTITERIREEAPGVIRTGLEAAGSVFGGGAGAVLGAGAGGVGALPGGVAGGGLGYAAGRELADVILGEQNETLGEELVELGENVLEGVKLEMLGYAGGALVSKAWKSVAKPATKKISHVIERLKAAQKLDIPVTVGEATESTTMQKAENFFRKLISPAGRFQKYDQKRLDGLLKARFDVINDLTKGVERKESLEALGIQIQNEVDTLLAGKVQAKGRVLDKMRDEVLEVFGSPESYRELGSITKDVIEAKQRSLEKLASEFFTQAGESLPQGGLDIVSTPKTIDAINKAIKEEKKALTAIGKRNIALLNSIKGDFVGETDTPVGLILSPEGLPVTKATKAIKPKKVSYDKLIRRRSDLNDIIAGMETTTGLPGEQQLILAGKKTSRLFRGIKRALDSDLATFSEKVGGDPHKFVKMGVATARRKFDFIKNPTIKQIIKSEPEKILPLVMRPRQVSLAKVLNKELGETGMRSLRESAINDLLGVGLDEPFTGVALKNRIKSVGDDTLRELLGEDSFVALKDLATKSFAQDRVVARLQVTGVVPKALGLGRLELETNKFFKTLVRHGKPQNLVDIIYQPGNTKNIRRVYSILRQAGQESKIQDLKAAYLESLLEVDPKTGYFHPATLVNKLKTLDDTTLKAAFTSGELEAFNDIAKVSLLVRPETKMGAGLEVIRFVAEPVGWPFAFIYLKKDGRRLLKKALRQQVRGVSRQLRDATMTKLLAIGIKGKADYDARNLQPVAIERMGVPEQELEESGVR